MSEYENILKEIETFQPVEGDWLELEELLNRLWNYNLSADDLPTLFAVFEKFPEEDGTGVLWSIVHGIENTGLAYEPFLMTSIQRQPSLMAEIMLKRIQNSRAKAQKGK